jgi:AraC-like DNA-binding protein
MNVIKMQSGICSSQNIADFCGFSWESIDSAMEPTMFEGARFILVVTGRGTLTLNQKQYDISPNTVISILPWDIVQINATSQLEFLVVRYCVFVMNNLIKSAYNVSNTLTKVIEILEHTPVINCSGKAQEDMQRIFREIESECGSGNMTDEGEPHPLHTIWLANKMVELIVFYCRLASSPEISTIWPKPIHEYADIFRYISSHLSEKITLKKLSTIFGFSEKDINNYIQEMVGLTLSDLLNEMRIVTTFDYLMYTDLNLEEISDLLGFVNSSHLSKVFLARIGDKIDQYRRTNGTVNEICKLRTERKGIDISAYIYAHYREPLSAKQVADHYSVTVDKMNQLLLYQVEKNFWVFLNTIRTKKACALLLSTDKSIIEVAMEVGFNSLKNFNRYFMRIMGVNPSSYRRARVPNAYGLKRCTTKLTVVRGNDEKIDSEEFQALE